MRLGAWDAPTKTALWHRWLWECDCNAPPLDRCFDMNEMHCLGILACLGEAADPPPEYDAPMAEELPEAIQLHPEQAIRTLSLRETLDQIECLQLHWGPILAQSGVLPAKAVVCALMARLGDIAHHAFPAEGDVLDDPQHLTLLPEKSGWGVVSRKSLRQAVCVLFALLRVHHIVSVAQDVATPTDAEESTIIEAMRQHHIESSQDIFSVLQQMVYLAPGQRLAYRTLFSGMYNSCSQVIACANGASHALTVIYAYRWCTFIIPASAASRSCRCTASPRARRTCCRSSCSCCQRCPWCTKTTRACRGSPPRPRHHHRGCG